jgi:hypothetical protein
MLEWHSSGLAPASRARGKQHEQHSAARPYPFLTTSLRVPDLNVAASFWF